MKREFEFDGYILEMLNCARRILTMEKGKIMNEQETIEYVIIDYVFKIMEKGKIMNEQETTACNEKYDIFSSRGDDI